MKGKKVLLKKRIAPSPRVKIRLTKPGDFGRVIPFLKQQPYIYVGPEDDRAGFARQLRRNPGCNFIAEIGDELIGVIRAGHDGRRGLNLWNGRCRKISRIWNWKKVA